MIATAYERMATAPCPAYQWVGQALNYCDRCSKPYWEHSHDERYKNFDGTMLGRAHRVIISTKDAELMKARWSTDG